MNPDVVIDSIASHLNALKTIVSWGVVLALGVSWAGLQNDKTIKIADLEMTRAQAFFVGLAVYLIANLAFLLGVWRITALLRLVDDVNFPKAYTTLATHDWLLNPWGYLGTDPVPALSTQLGIGLLIVCWWICMASIVLLLGTQHRSLSIALPLAFLAVGVASMWAMYDVYIENYSRLAVLEPAIHEGVVDTRAGRWVGFVAGVLVGWVLFLVARSVQVRRLKKA